MPFSASRAIQVREITHDRFLMYEGWDTEITVKVARRSELKI